MTEKSNQEAIAEIWDLIRATDSQIKATTIDVEKTSTSLRRLEGLFTSQWGKMLEALVEPAALTLFRQRGVDIHQTYQRSKSQVDGETMEIDLLLENGSDVVVVEVKSTLKVADVQEFLDDLDRFLHFFPKFWGKRIYGAVAGLTIDENADRFAYRQGLFVLGMSGDNMVHILNDERFQPRDFGYTEG